MMKMIRADISLLMIRSTSLIYPLSTHSIYSFPFLYQEAFRLSKSMIEVFSYFTILSIFYNSNCMLLFALIMHVGIYHDEHRQNPFDYCLVEQLINWRNLNIQNMDIIRRKKQQKFVLTFIDEAKIQQIHKRKHILVPQAVKDDVALDFSDMLEREWNVQPDQVIFNSKTKIQTQKAKKILQTAQNFNINANMSGLVSFRAKNKGYKDELPYVKTIFKDPLPQEDIDQFLSSTWFHRCIRFFVILYVIGLILTDYSFRLHPTQPLSVSNKISLHFQLFANCAFTLQILLKMFSKIKFFDNPWNVVSLIGCFACWSTIFLQFHIYDEKPFFHVLCILRILLGIRIIQIFEFTKNPFESFITTIPELGKIFFPYLIFIALYSVLGLILFSGANEHKCRETPQPINNMWPQTASNLCGSEAFQCKSGFCANPYDYGLPYNTTERTEYGNQFGLVTYDNIGKALLTTYHYVFLSNWTNIMYKFSHFIHPYLASFYFFTLALFLFFIMSNLNMITLCKAYIQKQKSREKMTVTKQAVIQQKSQEDLATRISPSKYRIYVVLQYIDILLVLASAVVVLIVYQSMSLSIQSYLSRIDFVLTLACFLVVILKTVILKKNILLDKFMVLDWFALMLSILDIIICFSKKVDALDPKNQVSKVLRGIKVIRIIKIIYFSNSWFVFEKTILKIFVETLNTVKYFFILFLFVILNLAFIGQNLFAHKIKFLYGTKIVDLKHGTTYVTNFDSLYKGMVGVTFLLENERWTQTMYNYYQAVGWVAVAYFTIVVFIIHLLLTRLFIAIFLCYFRRNLQKKSEKQQKIANQNLQICNDCNSSKQDFPIVQYLQNKSQAQDTNKVQTKQIIYEQQDEKLFWVFQRNSCFFQLARACYNSLIFHRITIGMIILQCITVVFRTNEDNKDKTNFLDAIQRIPLYFYIAQFFIGALGHGFYWGSKTYLKQSKINFINVLVVALVIVSQINHLGQLQRRIIRRFTILKILAFFTRTNKQTSIVLKSISSIAESFFRMIIIYFFLLIISCLLPLKLEKARLYGCYNLPTNTFYTQSYTQCMLNGGDWVKDAQSFSNIFESLVLMYQVITSQSWTYFIQRFKQTQPWDLFYVLNFFVYNTCLLNIFVGLTVQTYLSLKDEAYKLNLLKPNQRMWILIRNSINELVPIPMMKKPQGKSRFRKIAFEIISQPIYENFMDILPYINVIVYSMKYYRADPEYLKDLNTINIVILIIFMIDTILKLQLHWNFFYLDNSKVQFVGFVYHIIYGIVMVSFHVNHEGGRALQSVGALLLILRCKKLIVRFTWCKTLLNSVINVLPKCIIIGALLAVILFFYVSIGMEVFKHTKPTPKSDGYTTGFNNFFTSLMTLLKIVSNQSWFQQVSAFVRGSTPMDICFNISTTDDLQQYAFLGCGSKSAYLYFITFHMIIALLVLNLLIATMTAAYDENYEKQYKSVNIFQLEDCLKLWQKYDPDATGVIPYKKFWRLSSQIAILFGISKKKLIKSKQKFLEELDIQVCQSIDQKQTSVLCYKFHDVLMKFSKIKLTVSKTDNSEQGNEGMDFEIHPMIEKEIKDYITKTPPLYENIKPFKNLKSGQMKYFFGLLRKMRAWKIVAKKKDSSVISKLSHIIKVALEKKQKQENEITHIRNSMMSDFMAPIYS